jgi:hypothetical protein
MSTPFTVYTEHGRILYSGHCPDYAVEFQGERVLRAASNPDTDFVRDGQIVRKEPAPFRVVGNRIEGIPLPASAAIDGTLYELHDGVLDIEFDYPGRYSVTVLTVPFLPFTVTLTQP